MPRPLKPKPSYTYRESFPLLQYSDGMGYIIAWSAGKDSTALMEMAILASRDHRLVRPFIMTLLPGLDYYEFWKEYARRRWQVEVLEYQHWALSWYIRRGIFKLAADVTFPRVTLSDIEANVRADTGLRWIGYGYKSTDSLQRRGMMAQWHMGVSRDRYIFCPLKDWADRHVKAFLKYRKVTLPTDLQYRTSGIDLSPKCLHWLRQYWPRDYKKLIRNFPMATAQADRYEHFLQTRLTAVNIERGLGKFPDHVLSTSAELQSEFLDDVPMSSDRWLAEGDEAFRAEQAHLASLAGNQLPQH